MSERQLGGEVVLVFGAALRPDGTPSPALLRRVTTALTWGRARDCTFLLTGGIVTAPPAEAAVMARLMEHAGVASARLMIEDQARTTLESIRRCTPILTSLQPSRLIACSDDYHLLRCRWLLRLAGFRTEALPACADRATLWPRLREIAALPVDTLCWGLRL